jgi:cysteinyl-tRNA synthetase
LVLYNTLTREKQEFIPSEPGKVRIYNCGPTVYNYFHLGNARNFVIFDCLRRYLLMRGYRVLYVQNLTDIEDKIIDQALREGIPAIEVSRKYSQAYFRDSDALGIMRANIYPRATDHIEQIIELIQRLIETGKAYALDGDVYYEVAKFPEYGKLSRQQLEELSLGARIEVNGRKKNPVDFALWKSAKPGEPSWESPWGPGRPGWHIECSAMAMNYLGETIDIHGGGCDLVFPHHENEIAQSEGATGKPFALFWIHNGLLQVRGERMGKSMGNFLLVRELLKQHRSATLRHFLLSAHYRNPLDYTEDSLNQSKAAMEEFNNTLTRIKEHVNHKVYTKGDPSTFNTLRETVRKTRKDFIENMDDDLNTPKAFATVFQLVNEVKNFLGQKEAPRNESSQKLLREAEKVLLEMGGVLGILSTHEEVDPAVKALVKKREEARTKRDWAAADKIRQELHVRGYRVEDSPIGSVLIKNY